MKKIQDWAAFIFIISIIILAIISICGVWEIFSDDVINKSLQTFGLLSIVTVIVIVAGRFIDSRNQTAISTSGEALTETLPVFNPIFTSIRHMTVTVLIVSISLLALLGVLAIWEVFSGEVLNKSLSSITVIAFASLIIVITSLEREQHKLMRQKMSGGFIIFMIILGWFLFQFLFTLY